MKGIIKTQPAMTPNAALLKTLSGIFASLLMVAGLVFVIEPYSKLVAIKPDGKGEQRRE